MAGGKKKKTKNLLLLVGLLIVAVGAYAVIALWPKKEPKEVNSGTNERTTLVELDSEKVVKLEYQGQNSSMTLVKEEDTWYREDDREFPVNQAYANAMVNVAAGLSASKTINETPDSLGDYGLDTPTVWVRLTDSDGTTAEVKAGMKSPAGDGCYVVVDDSQIVYLATASLLTQFQYTENQMIAKHSTPSIAPEKITKILLEKPEGTLELSLEPGNEMDTTGYNPWLVKQGFAEVMPGNSDTIQVLVDNYASFPLGDCVEYSCSNPEQYGLKEPAASLNLIYYEDEETGETDEETGEAITEQKYYNFGLKVGGKDESGNYYVQLDGTESVYQMAAETVDAMIDLKAYDYVSRLPGLVNISQVDRITIEYGSTKHEMRLERHMETTTDSEGEETEEEVIQYFLEEKEVEKSDFSASYQKMIGVAIDGLVDDEIVAENSDVPVLTMTFDRTGAGLAPVVTQFYTYNENFNRISVDGISFFRVNIRDVESLIEMFEELFAE
ncbi:MAG: DUF4340 domain-containing protein [Lachnospiraceae bacterium]|jgi:hypothetical protein|nr:DUF4340 domain-containing protein [Lachnospiraceae bacterium]MCX4316640.1 DUF4340 domain-containing protein [Lachnospiraceae bacterium]